MTGNVQRAAAFGLGSAGATAAAGLVVFREFPGVVIPLVLMAVGLSVAYGPGYDESGRLRRPQRERFGAACSLVAFLANVLLAAWWVVTHPGD